MEILWWPNYLFTKNLGVHLEVLNGWIYHLDHFCSSDVKVTDTHTLLTLHVNYSTKWIINNMDPDQMPSNLASDLDQFCFDTQKICFWFIWQGKGKETRIWANSNFVWMIIWQVTFCSSVWECSFSELWQGCYKIPWQKHYRLIEVWLWGFNACKHLIWIAFVAFMLERRYFGSWHFHFRQKFHAIICNLESSLKQSVRLIVWHNAVLLQSKCMSLNVLLPYNIIYCCFFSPQVQTGRAVWLPNWSCHSIREEN